MDERVELVFLPSIGLSHITPSVEFAKLLIQHHHQFHVTVLVIPAPHNLTNLQDYMESVTNLFPRICFISLPLADLPPSGTKPGLPFISIYVQNHALSVKQALTRLISDTTTPNSVRLIVDIFTTSMTDLANELGIPSYLYFTSGASSLGFLLLMPDLDTNISSHYSTDSTELVIPSYVNSLPTVVLPSYFLNKNTASYTWALSMARWCKEAKGIIVNSFAELEPQALHAFDELMHDIPPVYLVGPLVDLEGETHCRSNQKTQHDQIMKWLDNQPTSSVIFLCFGTRGSMSAPQVKEIANGLERSGHRFLWSLRRQPASKMEAPSDYVNPEEVLPDGFLERVGERGLVCGWAPQVAVLAHKATGGFVSHCGWNSILESVWFGVPILTWPLDAEQKLNAFQLVKDLGLAVKIRNENHIKEGEDLVTVEEVENGVKCVMEEENDVRRRVKELSVKCRKVCMEGGSSWSTLQRLVVDLTR